MVDFKGDAADRRLRAMFAREPLADDGFSEGVLQRVRGAAWYRRILMLLAIVFGGLIAVEPITQLFAMSGEFALKFADGIVPSGDSFVALQGSAAIPLVLALFLTVVVAVRLLEDS